MLVSSTSTGVKAAHQTVLPAVFSVLSLWLVKIFPSFARRDPGILLVYATACTVLVLLSLSHLFQRVFSFPVLRGEDAQL